MKITKTGSTGDRKYEIEHNGLVFKVRQCMFSYYLNYTIFVVYENGNTKEWVDEYLPNLKSVKEFINKL